MTHASLAAVVEGPQGAPAVVLASSLGSTSEVWDPQVDLLREAFRVVRYDHRGHGDSDVPAGPYTIADLGRDVLALLDRFELERVSFCGVSLGGMTGIWLAANAPERIDRLVLVCTSARLGSPDAWHERARTVRADGTGAIADSVVARWFTPGFAQREPRLVERMRAIVSATPAEGYAGCCEAIARMDLRDDLARISAPTLVIAGSEDPAIPPDHGEVIADAISHARLVVVAGAHLPIVELPEVRQLIRDHLTREETT